MPKSKSPKTSARRVLATKVVSSGKRVWIYVDEWGEIKEHYENYSGEPTESDKKDAEDFLRNTLAKAYSDAPPQPEKEARRQPRVLLYMDPRLEEEINAALAVARAVSKDDWTPIQQEALEAAYRKVFNLEADVSRVLPLTPKNAEDYWDLLWRFSTDVRALGLQPTSEGRLEITHRDWLRRYRQHVKNIGKSAPNADRGAPPKQHTGRIIQEWKNVGSPVKPSYTILDAIARRVFGAETVQPKLRQYRERVRSAIHRHV